jgi:SdpI/YfhL protein family
MLTAVTGGLGLFLIALLMWLTVRAITRGELPVNGMLGFRTRTTTSSGAAWQAAHRAVVPGMRVIALAAVVAAILPVVLAAALGPDTQSADKAVTAAVGLGYAVVILLLIRVAFVAQSAAKRASLRRGIGTGRRRRQNGNRLGCPSTGAIPCWPHRDLEATMPNGVPAERRQRLRGVVADDGSEALYAIVGLQTPVTQPPGRIRLWGLDDASTYRPRRSTDR